MATVTDAQNDITSLDATGRSQVFVWMWANMTTAQKQSWINYEIDTTAGGNGDYIEMDVTDSGPGSLNGRLHLQPHGPG